MRIIKETIELIKEVEGKDAIWGLFTIGALFGLVAEWVYMMVAFGPTL